MRDDFLEESAFDAADGLDGFADDFDADALAGLESFADELDGLDAADGFEGDGLDALDGFDDLLDGADDAFELDAASGLYLPGTPRIISGPAAVTLARGLQPLVMDSLDADDSDAFFRRLRNVARRVASGVARVGRAAAPLLRRAAPLLRRALPMVQRVAGMAGPWGRLVSAGIGAAQGLMSGRGLRGALAGAVGGLVPGVGGRIASSLLGGSGMDDDASLDALADMSDARLVVPAVALPLGAGLAARVVARQAVPDGTPLGAAARGALRARAANVERQLLSAALQVPGTAGRRLRVLRAITHQAAPRLRAQGPAAALPAMPQVVRAALQRGLAQAQRMPQLGAVPAQVAARRVAARQRVLRTTPVAALAATA